MKKILCKETGRDLLLFPLRLHDFPEALNIVCLPREDPFGPHVLPNL